MTPADTAPKTDDEKRALGYVPVVGELDVDAETIRPIGPERMARVPIIADPERRPFARAIAEAPF